MAESLKKKFVAGSYWTTAEQIIKTVLGLVQLSITSRILTPTDFGIYAIAMFFFGLGSIAFSMGLGPALIQKKEDIKSYLDTTWTMGIIVATVASAILIVIIPFICNLYYHNTEATLPSIVIMINCILMTASNPALILYRKNIQLKKIFYLEIFPRIISFILIILCVYFLKSYWGLIIAILSESFIRLIYSYHLHPYKPHFKIIWPQFKELYSFSGWIQLKNIFSWFAGSVDTAIVGNVLGTVKLGFYNRAQTVTGYPRTFINAVVDSVAFPLYSQINDDKIRTNKIVISIQNLVICLLSFIAIVFLHYSDKVILIVLGEQWVSMSNIFSVLGVAYLFQTLLFSFNPVLRSLGLTRQEFTFYVVKMLIMVALLYPFAYKWDLLGAAWAVAVAVALAFPVLIIIIKKKTGFYLKDFYLSILMAVISVIATHYLLIIMDDYLCIGRWWLLEMFIAFAVLGIIELLLFLLTNNGPGEAIYQAFNTTKLLKN